MLNMTEEGERDNVEHDLGKENKIMLKLIQEGGKR
jgi:hypothetical protein